MKYNVYEKVIQNLTSSHTLKVTKTDYFTDRVEKDIKIILLGDTHCSKIVYKDQNQIIQNQIDKERPDYIFINGDIIDSPKELEKEEKSQQVKDLFKICSHQAQTISVLGNHDIFLEEGKTIIGAQVYDKWNELAKETGVILLQDQCYYDKKLFVAGGLLPKEYYYSKKDPHHEDAETFTTYLKEKPYMYKDLPVDVPTIGLFHSSEYLLSEENVALLKEYNLLMSGHHHGGCLPIFLNDLPGNRGLISPKKALFPSLARGVKTLSSGTTVIVSGGLVTLQDCVPRILQFGNFICDQQLDVITLTNNEEVKPYEATSKRVYTKRRFPNKD